MMRYSSKALLGFAFIFSSLPSFADYTPPRETVKFIYLFHKQINKDIELQQSLSNKISQETNSINCITPNKIAKISSNYKTPRTFIDALTRYINDTCEINIPAKNNTTYEIDIEKYDLYVLFSSEWGKNIESSLGHIRLAFMKNNAFMFDPIFTFSAYNFYSPETQTASLSNYLDAAFNSVDGKYSQSYFFDAYYETVMSESRDIHRFKVNTAIDITDSYKDLLFATKKTTEYNFFTKNCSSESLSFINSKIGAPKPIASFSPPSKQLSALIDNRTIKYIDTFIANTSDGSLKNSKNELDEVIYDKLSTIDFSSESDLKLTLYQSPRPKHGYLNFFSETKAFQIHTNLKNKENSFTLMSKTVIDSISRQAPSFMFNLGYSNNSQIYVGIGEVFRQYGFSSMLGYSSELKWSSYSRFHASFEKFDFTFNYSSNFKTSNVVNKVDFYPTSSFSVSFETDYSHQKLNLHYYF
ncbi:hypothetical protein NBRC116188_29730 [Oceaniserpentilla sp. 4NH20-0058]|uniref:lipoprotein N-acyltransferase Lnb domain-containing protein n=1 Tax=Oceaniserpentilla sp. 4NH20-0058 TaxID=3127660 RepID=UPI00310B209F